MEQVLTVLEPLARRDGDADQRSAGQRRADALTDVFGVALSRGDLPVAGGERPRLTYVMPALDDRCGREFALDLDRHPGQECPTGAWTGPTTRTLVETLQCESQVNRLTVDADGRIVSLEAF